MTETARPTRLELFLVGLSAVNKFRNPLVKVAERRLQSNPLNEGAIGCISKFASRSSIRDTLVTLNQFAITPPFRTTSQPPSSVACLQEKLVRGYILETLFELRTVAYDYSGVGGYDTQRLKKISNKKAEIVRDVIDLLLTCQLSENAECALAFMIRSFDLFVKLDAILRFPNNRTAFATTKLPTVNTLDISASKFDIN